jgi:hypothetical protein
MEDVTRKAVLQLLKNGHVILQIEDKNRVMYFEVFSWQPGYFNTAESIEFNTVEGIDITAFLSTNAAMYHDYTQFSSAYARFIEDNPVIRCEFTRDSKWYKWQLATETASLKRR